MIMKKSEGVPPPKKINTAYNLWLYVIMDTSVANLSSEWYSTSIVLQKQKVNYYTTDTYH